ncbi:MAG TPA: 50S ribosomal protein L18 [Saprospiraceae bacterium]|nr:50S ribosomal protein L18 [Saprospiraceae bacterium]
MSKLASRTKIKRRVRSKIVGTPERPRLSVFRSNKGIYAQIIDDRVGKTLLSASTLDKDVENKGTKSEQSKAVGELIAKKAQDAGINTVVFDRNGYRYHGRVKALAEGARAGGLTF